MSASDLRRTQFPSSFTYRSDYSDSLSIACIVRARFTR